MRVGPKVEGKAYTLQNSEWKLTDKPIQYPEGWYLIPPRFVTPEDFDQ